MLLDPGAKAARTCCGDGIGVAGGWILSLDIPTIPLDYQRPAREFASATHQKIPTDARNAIQTRLQLDRWLSNLNIWPKNYSNCKKIFLFVYFFWTNQIDITLNQDKI